MMREMKSRRNEQQYEENPQEIEDNRRYMTNIWSKDEDGETVESIQKMNEELQQ